MFIAQGQHRYRTHALFRFAVVFMWQCPALPVPALKSTSLALHAMSSASAITGSGVGVGWASGSPCRWGDGQASPEAVGGAAVAVR